MILHGRAETRNFSASVEKHFYESALLLNCFMMNLKLQNAAKRRFGFVECYAVKCFHALRTFSIVLYVFGLFMNN